MCTFSFFETSLKKPEKQMNANKLLFLKFITKKNKNLRDYDILLKISTIFSFFK